MRATLLILVFCNVVFFMWQLTVRQPEKPPAVVKQSVGVAQLALLNPPQPPTLDLQKPEQDEKVSIAKSTNPVDMPVQMPQARAEAFPDISPVLPDDLSSEAASPVLDDGALKPAVCYAYGVFKTEAAATGFVKTLPEDWQSQVISQRIWVEQGYWVKVPAPLTMALARTALETIKAKGVEDYWLVPKGRNRGVISLGLFANIRRAELRLAQLEKIGVAAEIELKRQRLLRFRAFFKLANPPSEALKDAGLAIEPGQLEQQPDCDAPSG